MRMVNDDVFVAFKTITGLGSAQMGYRALRRNLKGYPQSHSKS
jgi:hypothetical protein